ncbi:MAG: hypothetical protein M1824_000381 [Vezdaea acicularis]|nr:MAG: hypothetical protein M1824_000381 [Vezdaea acicularis]
MSSSEQRPFLFSFKPRSRSSTNTITNPSGTNPPQNSAKPQSHPEEEDDPWTPAREGYLMHLYHSSTENGGHALSDEALASKMNKQFWNSHFTVPGVKGKKEELLKREDVEREEEDGEEGGEEGVEIEDWRDNKD